MAVVTPLRRPSRNGGRGDGRQHGPALYVRPVPPRTITVACALIAAVLSMAGCRDRFECGILIDGTVTRCTGATEICLCSERRCAETAPNTCPASGYAYVFQEGNEDECVPPDALDGPVITANVTGAAALCPDQVSIPPSCGVRVSGQVAACPGNQTCLCDLNLCVSFERTDDCPTGWRRAVDATCLDVTAVDTDQRPADDGLCAGARTPGPRVNCGRPNDVGAIEDCPDDQTCICSTHRCAIADATACPETRFRYAPDAEGSPVQCVPVDDSNGERVTAGACTDFRPSPIPCGADDGDGPDCPDPSQQCVCGTGLCAETAPASTCAPTGLRYVGSQECVEAADQPTIIEDGLCAPACGRLAGDGRIVQCPFGACACTDDGGRCTVADPSCPTGNAFVSDDRCVTFNATDAVQTIAAGELCPATFEDRACGGPGPDGRLARCGPDETCVCEAGTGRCARPEPTCPDGRAYVPTARCAARDGNGVTSVSGLLCPGATAAPPVACGALDGAGRIRSCAPAEQCICRSDGGTCAVAEPACPFGLSAANDGTCVALSESTFTRPVAGDALCPPVPPTPIACGQAAQTECAGELRCGCSGATGVCVIEQPACASGFAEANTLRCIAASENRRIIDSGACATGGP